MYQVQRTRDILTATEGAAPSALYTYYVLTMCSLCTHDVLTMLTATEGALRALVCACSDLRLLYAVHRLCYTSTHARAVGVAPLVGLRPVSVLT